MPDPDVQTMVIRPDPQTDGQGGKAKLSRDDLFKRATALGYSKAGAEGIVRNFERESQGNPAAVGDNGTSRGMAQWHNSRKTDLEAFAKAQKGSPDDPDIQFKFFDKEMREKYPALRAQLMKEQDPAVAEDAFKRIYERPASVLWANRADGSGPVLGTDKYRFSDYALNEHDGRKNTDVMYMPPQDYLDLSPELDGKPFESPGGRALKSSVDAGDAIQSIPTLDMKVNGNTGTVTDQDGRHRALMAQQQGIDAIPVAVRQTGQGQPTEIQGMSGKVLPNDFPKAADVKRPDQSLWSKAVNAIVPQAEAAEPINPYAGLAEPTQEAAAPAPQAGQAPAPQAGQAANPYAGIAVPDADQPAAEPDGMLMSGVKAAGAGLGRTVLAGQELVGQGLQAVGATGTGKWLVDDARSGVSNLNKTMAPDEAAHPIATGLGDMAGSMVLPGGIAGKIGGNALRAAAIGGGVAGLLQPAAGDGAGYWENKAMQAGVGSALGVGANAVARGVGHAVAPVLRNAAQILVGEGVQLTPGQLAGGAAKRAEDTLASVPFLGSTIRKAQQRSIETFNRAAINRSLADINSKLPPGLDSGHDAIAEAENQFKIAYNQVVPNMTGIRDPVFVQKLNDVVSQAIAAKVPPNEVAELKHIIQTEILDKFDANGRITGDQAQNIGTMLDSIINPLKRGNVYQQQLGRHVRQADAVLDDMMAAHNPTMQAAKDRIDAGYAKFKTVQRAATAAGTRADGTFTPAQLSRAVLARDRSKDKAAFARGDAMMQDLAQAAKDVLPQTVPDSGTPERALLMAALGGAAKFEPLSAAAIGLSSLPYTAPGSRVTNAMIKRLAQQPGPTRNALAQILRRAGPALAPAAGEYGANQIPSMVIHPGDHQ